MSQAQQRVAHTRAESASSHRESTGTMATPGVISAGKAAALGSCACSHDRRATFVADNAVTFRSRTLSSAFFSAHASAMTYNEDADKVVTGRIFCFRESIHPR